MEKYGVKILGPQNLPAEVGRHASELYARNVFNLFKLVYRPETKSIFFDENDEIIQAILLTHKGQVLRTDLLETSETSKQKKTSGAVPKKKKTVASQKKPAKKPLKRSAKNAL